MLLSGDSFKQRNIEFDYENANSARHFQHFS